MPRTSAPFSSGIRSFDARLRRLSALALTVSAILLFAEASQADETSNYPARPVRLIVPSGAGGTTDIVARIVAQALTQSMGATFIVEQKVGGNTNIGSAYVSNAPPDGYTLLVNTDTLTSNATMYKNPGYDVISGFAPVTMLTKAAGALVVRKDLGASTVEQFVALARTKGKSLLVASTGTGTVSHLTGVMFRQRMDLPEWTDVPYQGAAKAMTDLLGGHVDAIVAMIPNFVSQAASGNIKLLAVTTKDRSPAAPGVPTIAETTALKDFDVSNWTGMFAPAGTPRPVVEKLAAEVARALKDPAIVQKLVNVGLEPASEGPDALARSVRDNVAQCVMSCAAPTFRPTNRRLPRHRFSEARHLQGKLVLEVR